MRKFIFILLFIVCSCGPVRYIPVNNNETVNIRDSVRIRDSVITTFLTKERVVDTAPVYDTLKMETKYSKSISFIDTLTHSLKGELTQKDNIPVKIKTVYLDRVIYKDHFIDRDVPVPVEVKEKYIPKIFWINLIFNILFVIFIVIKVKSKFF